VSKIKTQPVGGNQRTGLAGMLAQELFQGPVQQMGRRMAAADSAAARAIDPGGDHRIPGQGAAFYQPLMNNLPCRGEECPGDDSPPSAESITPLSPTWPPASA